MSAVRFAGIGKSFGAFTALHPTDLDVADGEFLTLLGPSGSGKTTLLNICAGYLPPSRGRLLVGERDVTATPARRRNMGMVFQSYALFPHMDVHENVAYGLRVRRVPASEIARRVAEALRVVRLEGFARRAIRALSGGQQQRVALARALVIEPDVLLMDEPLGALDRQLRKEVQLEIRRMHLARPRTTLYVTHDQEEALVMSDRVAVMRAGSVVQVGTGRALYDRPADAFVARFLGESNLVAGTVAATDGTTATLTVPGLPHAIAGSAASGLAAGARAVALIRPETVRPEAGGLPARIVERVHLGEIVALRLVLGNGLELWCRRLAGTDPAGEGIEIGWDPASVSILPDAA
ncbi:MAG: ABC transporter ATP-binding protein [Alphaproteobacteria bacterium]|nr:ABC transporter ATP-binding protein [Alphaproteobacteria bacterium]